MPLLHLLSAALLLAPTSPTEVAHSQQDDSLLRFSENLLIPDEVFKAILHLPPDSRPSPALALSIERTLVNFLHKSGYELASVNAVADEKHINLTIDEGRLDKVVFRGRLSLKTLRFKLGLPIVYNIFNRPALTREMKKLAEALKIERVWFELVPTKNVVHKGPQLEQLVDSEGEPLVRPQQPFELHIFFEEKDWDTGFGVDFRSTYWDGFEITSSYQGTDVFFKEDRWRTAAGAAVNIRQRLRDDRLYPTFTRATAEARWFLPTKIFVTRPFVWLESELLDRQRPDLGLESYFASLNQASVGLSGNTYQSFEIIVGVGLHFREIFALHQSPNVVLPEGISPYRQLRGFALFRLNSLLEKGFQRSDRATAFRFELKQYSPSSNSWFGYGAYRYQLVIPWGWHDLWLRTRGKWFWGKVPFSDEEPVGEYLYGLLGKDYIHRIGTVSGEFRFSITRDILKLSVFHSIAVFQEFDRTRENDARVVRVGNAFGPGLHLLIESMFQLDAYMAFGFRSDGRFDTAVSVLLEKVF